MKLVTEKQVEDHHSPSRCRCDYYVDICLLKTGLVIQLPPKNLSSYHLDLSFLSWISCLFKKNFFPPSFADLGVM